MALWGLHMAMTQGLLIASGLAGLLWDQLGASFTFVASMAFSVVALSLLWFRLADKRTLLATKIVALCLT